jgi:SnoaL-like protein
MGDEENRQVIGDVAKSLEAGDLEGLKRAYDQYAADDYVQEWPQSGERIRGKANAMAINDNYPGFPTISIRDIFGSGDVWVAQVTLDYGQGPVHGVTIFEFKDGKIAKEIDYFADPFEAPEWRAQWVEKM